LSGSSNQKEPGSEGQSWVTGKKGRGGRTLPTGRTVSLGQGKLFRGVLAGAGLGSERKWENVSPVLLRDGGGKGNKKGERKIGDLTRCQTVNGQLLPEGQIRAPKMGRRTQERE